MEEYVIQRRCHISNKHLYIHLYIAKVHSIHIWLNMASAEFLHFGYLWLFPAHFPRGKGLVKLLFFTFLYPCYINPQDLAISREHVFFEPLPCTWRLGFSDFKLLRFTNFYQLRLPGMYLSDPNEHQGCPPVLTRPSWNTWRVPPSRKGNQAQNWIVETF